MVEFNKLFQGGKYKFQGRTLFYIEKNQNGQVQEIFTKEGSTDNKFAMYKFLFFLHQI